MKSLYGMLLLFLCVAGAHAEVYRVDADSTSSNPNGASWTSAFSSIRDAVQSAHQAGGGEVWVAEGTYTGSAGNPTDSSGGAAGDTSLILLEGVHVYGGFSGVETIREDRNWQAHPTIIDGQNVRRGVFSSGIPYGGATLDGFTIRRGHATEFGGGFYNDQSAPFIANCRFENNHAALHGGGVFNYESPALILAGRSVYDTEIAEQAGVDLVPAFSGVVFQNNSATYGGGGLYSDANFLVLERCVFDSNEAGIGGGMYDKGGKTEFFRCTFQNNTATDAGAGYCYEGTSTTEFTNCLLNDNNSGTMGGAIYHDGYRVSLTHTTIAKNSAPQGGGVFGGQAFSLALNTIAYDNGASNIDDASDSPFTMLASCLEFEPADPTQGVVNVNPLFINPAQKNYALSGTSPSLDTGEYHWAKVNDDLYGVARPQGAEVDMGAFEADPLDSDADGLPDQWELDHFGNLAFCTGTGDQDHDGLTNAEEYNLGTDPNDADSDDDGYNDRSEADVGSDPNNAGDVPPPVIFPDPGLEAAVRLAIGRPTGDITQLDLVGQGFNILDASHMAISDLSGLEYCTDLFALFLDFNNIVDLTPLAGLTNLQQLSASENLIESVEPLADLDQLAFLDVGANRITSLDGLAHLPSLYFLLVNDNELVDISPLATIPSMNFLYLGENNIQNIDALQGLNLYALSLFRAPVEDISVLSGLQNLQQLDLTGTEVSSVEPLAGLPNLFAVYVGHTNVGDLAPLASLPMLRILEIDGLTGLDSLNSLSTMTGIEELYADHLGIADLSPLANLTGLKVLYLRNNGISDITPLVQLPVLRSLYLEHNHVGDYSGLAAIPTLRTLDLAENGLTDIEDLAQFTQLNLVYLSGNQISDASSLTAIPGLRELDLSSNGFTNFASLPPLTGNNPLLLLGDNGISDLAPLIAHMASSTGVHIELGRNPLPQAAFCTQLPALEAMGHQVYFDLDWREEQFVPFVERALGCSNPNENPDGDDATTLVEINRGTDPLVSGQGELVEIADPYLEIFALVALDKYSGFLYTDEAANIASLSVPNAHISDLAGVEHLTGIQFLDLSGNDIVELDRLIANPGLGAGDTLLLEGNPLSQQALCVDIPALIQRGVIVETGSAVCITDTDSDGLNDVEEDSLGTDPNNPDTDADSLVDGEEVDRGTNPLQADSDNDGIADGTEVAFGTDPLSAASVPSDVYVNGASGSDDTGLGTQAAPWATVAFAIASVEGTTENTVSIHIAEGVYTHLNAAGGALVLDSHEHLFGGYEATGWTRDVREHETTFDASVAANENPARNVVVLDAILDARLDGFTVTGAYTAPDDYTTQNTAGIFARNLDSSSSIINCQIMDNHTNGYGSGGILLLNASPTIRDCNIVANYAHGEGGGIGIRGNSHPLIEKCLIRGNEGHFGGGGVVVRDNANALITNCIISANSAGNFWGGAVFFNGGTATISNSTIAHNDADTRCGGGIAVMSSTVRLVNTIFAENRHHAIADFTDASGLVLENCLFDANPEGDYYGFSTEAPLYYDGAASLNSLLPLADGNVDGPVLFVPADERVFTADSSYNPTTNSTTFTDASASFVPGSLRGKLVVLSDSDMYQFLVLGNTATTLEVLGDLSFWPASGDRYAFIDYRLQVGSAAIDMGIDTSAPADGGVTTDLDGIARGFDGDSLGAATADGSDYDIGAYESDTPAVVDAITVLSPNGGELISRGSLQTITWSSTGDVGAHVKIMARKGTSSATIVASTPNDGNYAWLVPATYPLGNNFVVEVSSVSEPTILDVSDAFFTVQASAPVSGTITVVSPNGGETLQRGATYPITWTSTGDIGASVKILVRRATSSAVVVSSTPNDGHFAWTVPNYPVGSGYTIEISSVLAPTILDSSNGDFSLSDSAPPAASITVTAPNGGESFAPGATLPITWTSTGTTGGEVEILARSAGQTFTVAASTANDGAFDWAIPGGQAPGTDYTIEVRSLSLPSIGDVSDAAFTIGSTSPVTSLTLISPNGGETLVRGSLVEIQWSSTGDIGANVRIIARRGTSSGIISTSTPDDGSYAWTVPTNYPTGTGFTLEISSVATPALLDTTDAPFSISATAPTGGSITVLSPNGGESFLAGTTAPITWNTSGDAGTQVQIIAHGAGQSLTLAAATDNDGAFDWAIPAGQAPGTDYTIEVRSLAFPAVGDSSNAAFTIGGTPPASSITVLSPNGGENINRGATVQINWSSTGSVGANVRILARKGSSTGIISNSTANDGNYVWTVPATFPLGPGMTLEISSVTAPSILDTCDATFTIAP